MVADLLAWLMATLTASTQNAKHHAVIVAGYPTHQRLVGSESDLHPGGDGIYLGNIMDIRFSRLRFLTGKKLPFKGTTAIRIMTDSRPKASSHMLLLVDVTYRHPVAPWWSFTRDREYACIPAKAIEDYKLDEPIRHLYNNDKGDLCLR